jgi:hypothetical protein
VAAPILREYLVIVLLAVIKLHMVIFAAFLAVLLVRAVDLVETPRHIHLLIFHELLCAMNFNGMHAFIMKNLIRP